MAKNLNNIIARSQRLMLDENWNRQVEMGAAAQRAGSMNGKSGGNDLAALEAMAFGTSSPSAGVTYNPIPENFVAPKTHITDDGRPIQILHEERVPIDRSNSKIPKEILESYRKNPSPTADAMSMMAPPESYYGTQQVTEQRYAQPQAQPQYIQQPTGGGIDYHYIKYIIEEAVNNAMRTRLDESMNMAEMKGMRIAPGGVIQFLDKSGNLYEGKLTLKKKAK